MEEIKRQGHGNAETHVADAGDYKGLAPRGGIHRGAIDSDPHIVLVFPNWTTVMHEETWPGRVDFQPYQPGAEAD